MKDSCSTSSLVSLICMVENEKHGRWCVRESGYGDPYLLVHVELPENLRGVKQVVVVEDPELLLV